VTDIAWYRLHPIIVHFPIVLCLVGLGVWLLAQFRKKPTWLAESAPWFLWVGTIGAWAALGSGLLAQETAPHVPSAWVVLADHELYGRWAVGLFTTLAFWRFWLWKKRKRPTDLELKLFMCVWAAAVGVLLYAAHLGGKVVYDFGMGVVHQEMGAQDDDVYEEEE
jgi:uncharacterized membrane protein